MTTLQSLPDLLTTATARFGPNTALVYYDRGERRTWTYAELQDHAHRSSRALAALGCGKGDRVVLQAPNSPEWVAAFFGILGLGAIVVPLDVRSGADFVERIVARSEPRLILTSSDLQKSFPATEAPIVTLDTLKTTEGAEISLPAIAPDDIAELVFTSGTTGAPKGVILTHGNIIADLEAAYVYLPPESRYRMLSLLPLSHMLEQIAELFFALSAGARVIYVESLQPSTIFAAMREEHVNGLAVVPQILTLFMSGIEREVRKAGGERSWTLAHRIAPYLPFPLRRLLFRKVHERLGGNLEFIVSGGAFLDHRLAQRWENMGIKIAIGYGATEAAPIIAMIPLSDRNHHSVGRAIPCCEIKIAENGEILVRGPNVTRGYWQDDAATQAAFDDGWYRTGDLGHLDADGWLYLKGRLKNMIVLGNGMNVFPEDIENILTEDLIVQTAIVLGRPREDDVEVHAVLVLPKGADQAAVPPLIKSANARLAPHQRIKDFTVWPDDVPLPQTHTLKPKRAEILQMLLDGVGAKKLHVILGRGRQVIEKTRPADGVSRRVIAAYSVASLGCGLFYAFSNAVLPLLLKGANPLVVNLLSNTRSIEGTIIQPLVGGWSDRIWTRLGRRRPFMLVAIPLSALIMALTPAIHAFPAVVACIILFSLLFNVAVDPYTALQGDIAPPWQRPTINAVATLFQFIGQVALTLVLAFGPFHGDIPPLVYPAIALGIVLSFTYTVIRVPEPRERVVGETRHSFSDYLTVARQQDQALIFLTALLFYNTGVNVILVNLTRFAVHILHTTDADAVKLFLVLVLSTGLGALPAGWAARRFGVKRVVVAGLIMIAIAASCAFIISSAWQVVPALVVAGFGSACMTQTWPMLTLLIPAEQTGLFAGLKTSAESVSAFASSFVAFAMVAHWGYRSIFMALLIGVLLTLAILTAVRMPHEAN